MYRKRSEIVKTLANYLPVKSKLNIGVLICKDINTLTQIQNSFTSSGDYINFQNTSTWKTITGFAGKNSDIFVKIVKFNKFKVKVRETLTLPDPGNGYRRIQGEAYNLIKVKAEGLRCPEILGIVTRKFFGLSQEQHLIIESFPNHENVNQALSDKSISTDLALDILDKTIMNLHHQACVHLDFHMDNILVNINDSKDLDYKIIDLEFFDFLENTQNLDGISWHLAQAYQNKEKNIISTKAFDSFAHKVLKRETRGIKEFQNQIEKYNYWKASTLKRERFWYKTQQA